MYKDVAEFPVWLINKNPQRAQTSSAKAAHYPIYISLIPDLKSQHGDPDHPNNYLILLYIIAELS